MANSILGAGIIGLPYAVSQAGFFLGIVLLVVICAATDWTIRLVVINAKLSGRTSYIEVMNSCFGPSGRAAVSFFQFSFAFGGMCAFGIIIGDTIPHVIRSIFPTLHTIPVLSMQVQDKI
ncbi:transmembrane amino acid transporter protein-domain-containing protein [Suillus bovinus]|uniref:transmembrane amino acid transporter protein-domain-containing protein n=1 Tax=Suillus bovinus TaxID=48563 RepID=UPI001B85EB2E|nr:transmembrane amino acid transporter protein-domain-containing protein [Suillus bovinus]KAG2132025.1 transmembrane amino acid transporter protein-domain-containing protein [Suillus bovinus]